MAVQRDPDHLTFHLAIYLAGLLFLSACFIQYLPRDVSMVLVTWTMLSLPLSICFGHSVLSEP